MEKKTKLTSICYIAAGIVIGVLLKLFVIDFVRIQGTSMEPAIQDGDFLPVNRLSYGLNKPFSNSLLFQWKEPSAGDVVIYMMKGSQVVKRCVAVGPEPLEFSASSVYNLKVKGVTYPLTEEQYHLLGDSPMVPEGYILAIGDNAEVSIDSRNYGFVPVKNILGKVLCK